MKRLGWVALALMLGGAGAGAQQDEAAAPVRVARLTYFAGAVEVARADNTEQADPVMNMSLAEGTRLTCGDYGQAEVEFEDGSLMRVTPRSAVALNGLGLESGVARTAVTVMGGLVYFELRKSAGYSYSVTGGGVAMSPLENSVVRVSVADAPAVFSVFSGSVRLEHGFSAEVRTGESLHADAKDATRYFLNDQITIESWDAWNAERDRAGADEGEKRTTARDGFAGVQGYGWSDLDANGTWYDVPGEGRVWQPYAADDGFDPYGYGDWVWQGVGYVWASGYAWGWTPFRCGHWDYYPGFGWGWVPDGRCGNWGSGGGEVLLGHRLPPRYKPTAKPPLQPLKTHPIIIVRGPNGPRPPLRYGAEQVVQGKKWTPLARAGSVATAGAAQGLSRDYPVSVSTHLAVLGKVPSEGQQAPMPAQTSGGWRSVSAAPVASSGAGARPRATPTGPAASPGRTAPEPVRTSSPVQAAPRSVAPVAPPVAAPRPAPVYQAPPPPPAPVYHAPPPPPAPVQAAPARVDSAKPK